MDTSERAAGPGRRAPGIAAAGLLLCLAASCGRSSAVAPDDGRAVAEAFLADIRGGRVDAAWAGTSTEFKSLLGQDGLRDLVKAKPALKAPAEFLGIEPTTRNGLSMAECSFRAEVKAKAKTKASTATIKVLIAREDDAWKVERLVVE